MAAVSENARQREAFRYDTSLLARSVVNETQESPDPARLTTSHDPALSAFAQLGALRLGGRSLISIFDRKYQHIVAESTAVTTLGPDEPQGTERNADNSLWLCGTAIPRSYGVCEHVLTMPMPEDTSLKSLKDDDGSPISKELGELPVSVVHDLTLDRRFDAAFIARNNTSLHFYAGIPLRTRRGINIGVYCVFGRNPREGIEPESIQFLRDMSRTVMSYLEQRVAATSHRRNVRMVRGLGSLVEGHGSMSNWWLDRNPASFTTTEEGEGALNTQQQALQRAAQEPTQGPSRSQQVQESNLLGAANSPDTPPSLSDPRVNGSGSSRVPTTSGTARTSSLVHDREDESLSHLQNLFSRAANIVRESVEVEGALFLDAAVGSFGGLATQGRENSVTSSEASRDSASACSSAEENKSRHSNDGRPALCKILGFSQTDTSSINNDQASLTHANIPEKFLRSVLRRYPNGAIFNFDENGELQSGDSEEDALLVTSAEGIPLPRRKRPQGRRSDRDVLITAFAGARSVALIPMFDSHKERWYAGGFVWTRTPTRIFSVEGELSYLKALGTIVMAEVARINALRADKAKADVLGSLSHELRSPLHGIVLGVELLNDTQLSGFQDDLVGTIETCGRTLMETMDHLLDFSRINHFTKMTKNDLRNNATARGGRMHKNTTMEPGMLSLFADISLGSLVEEVVESIFSGHSFQQTSGKWKTTTRNVNTNFAQAGTLRRLASVDSPGEIMNEWPVDGMKQRPPVTIYLDIQPGVAWDFCTQPGAIRRVIMNLFGNALKYTAQGSIVVSLKQEPAPRAKKGKRTRVSLSISDSGKGISADYLRTQLFTPFSQENTLSPGTGLGLSLVKQIIHSLKGEIDVESSVGRGTSVRVTLPLVPSRLSPGQDSATPAEIDFLGHLDTLRGRSVCLVGFKDVEDPDYPLLATAQLSPHPKALMDVICGQWLGMELVSAEDAASTPPSVFVVTQESMSVLPNLCSPKTGAVPVLVMCHHALAAHELTMAHQASGKMITFISQPPGPRKLAKVLSNILSVASQPSSSGGNSRDTVTPRPQLYNGMTSFPFPLSVEHDAAVDISTLQLDANPVDSAEAQTKVDLAQLSVGPNSHSAAESFEEPEQSNCFLLVDDNTINLRILSSYIKKLKRSFDTAENGLEAFEAYRQNPAKYCCIFMDISMPVMDGLEATRSIRNHEQINNLPQTLVVALTGLASADTQKDAFASGVNLFLTKPVPLKELSRVLETHKL